MTSTLTRPRHLVGYAGAAAFVLATVWFGLAREGVTVTAAPPFADGDDAMRTYYTWLGTTLSQERGYLALSIVAFGCLAAAALALGGIGGRLVTGGALTWIVGSLLEIGGHRAVGLMATHDNPIDTTNSIAFTIDQVAYVFGVATFALVGAGLLAIAASRRFRGGPWSWYTAAVAVLMFAVAALYDTDAGDLTMIAVGALAVPAWLVWTAASTATGRAG